MKNLRRMITILLAGLLLLPAFGCKSQPANPYPERDVQYGTTLPQLGEDAVAIHYQRSDNKYDPWTLWLWDPAGNDDGLEDDFNYQDDYGVIAFYPLSHFGDLSAGMLGLIVKTKGSWTKDGTESDRFINFASLKKDDNNIYHVYLAGGDEHMYTTPDKVITDEIISVRFNDEKNIFISCSNPIETLSVYQDDQLLVTDKGAGRKSFTYTLPQPASLACQYRLEVTFRNSGQTLSAPISTSGLFTTEAFNEQYYYDGELGAIYAPGRTTFKVWSPISTEIRLRIYANGTPVKVSAEKGSDEYQEYVMTMGDKGVWQYTLDGDQQGKYYTYVVYNYAHPEGAEIVDPYARSAGISGLRGMVVDFSRTDPEGWEDIRPLAVDRTKVVVWETHVADVTSSATWTGSENNRRRYLGLIEEGTTYSDHGMTVTTGFDHIRELGVNAVQLQPIFDQANDETSYVFNWGYNPLNYNVLEGLYSSDPYDGYARINEFKEVVSQFNRYGITVIMDVVYNHVNDAGTSNFNVLMPDYYFRLKADGTYSNGSGCGNETASERPMMRKFIIDSVCFWLEEYKLGGFRFDLMGLHDIETMNQVVEAARKINKNVIIYGEPWTGGGTPLANDQQAKQENANKFVGYGQFNDQMRDGLIKGGLNDPSAKGWITGTNNAQSDLTAISQGINGYTTAMAYSIDDAYKTVNYVTCHDNFTLYDRVKAAGIEGEETIRKMCMLANSVVMTSKATAFMLAGEEFLRTKGGDSNSYKSPDSVNELNYALKIKNNDIYENYRKLIAFKQTFGALNGEGGGISVNVLENGAAIVYELDGGSSHYMIIHANGTGCAEGIDANGYTVYLDTLGKLEGQVQTIVPEKYQTLILVRK
ncbi:MAG: type I pullulanase [Erysipelotrichaceae bacterium]|nr:type I pullulanase [Erysipelotrichaceae bacterium]